MGGPGKEPGSRDKSQRPGGSRRASPTARGMAATQARPWETLNIASSFPPEERQSEDSFSKSALGARGAIYGSQKKPTVAYLSIVFISGWELERGFF